MIRATCTCADDSEVTVNTSYWLVFGEFAYGDMLWYTYEMRYFLFYISVFRMGAILTFFTENGKFCWFLVFKYRSLTSFTSFSRQFVHMQIKYIFTRIIIPYITQFITNSTLQSITAITIQPHGTRHFLKHSPI